LTLVDPIAAARVAFQRAFQREPSGTAFAPGRVNLIGEHTDYNDGFVLPMAIEEGIAAAFAPRDDTIVRVHASDIRQTGQTRDITIDALLGGASGIGGWFKYPAGVAWAMRAAGLPLTGTDIALASNLPSGAGLSSSAAVELAVARALAASAAIEWVPREVAKMAQHAEHEFAGVACGIMDQMAVACAQDGRALLIDCRSLDTEDVELPPYVRVVVINSGVRRSLSSSAYNERRAACERAAAAVRELDPAVRALRDVDEGQLAAAKDRMDDVAYRRASHVVAENRRPGRFAAALRANDTKSAGRLMVDSHESLRDLYEVSCAELDTLVRLSLQQPGCYGARLTGAGFGGCIVALVDAGHVDAFSTEVPRRYSAETGRQPQTLVSRPSAGARLVI
jgi:galactokinase